MPKNKKATLDQVYQIKRTEWFNFKNLDFESAKQQHRDNVKGLQSIEEWRSQENRPIAVLCIHGSGRDVKHSCAHEKSSSQMLLKKGLSCALEEWEGTPVDIEHFDLRRLFLEPCNGCVSTASALCNFPCTCFPGDDITKQIYPAVMLADVIFWSTPVNQSMVSTRTKTVLDRLISLDGGYFIEELPVKDDDFRDKMIHLSHMKPVYDQRMFGKVAAYFVTSKDANNPHDESAPYPKPFDNLTYADLVVGGIAHQGAEFGWFHADPYYVIAAADPDVEYSYDKDHYDKDSATLEKAKEVVLASLKKAEEFRKEPPKFTSPGRINRT
jgi:multimeric flavodoxin WrbA